MGTQTLTLECTGAAGALTGQFILQYMDWRNETWSTWAITAETLDDTYAGNKGIAVKEALVASPTLRCLPHQCRLQRARTGIAERCTLSTLRLTILSLRELSPTSPSFRPRATRMDASL